MIRRYLARRKMRWAVRWLRFATLKQRRIADYQRVRKILERQRDHFFKVGQRAGYNESIRLLIANSSAWSRPVERKNDG